MSFVPTLQEILDRGVQNPDTTNIDIMNQVEAYRKSFVAKSMDGTENFREECSKEIGCLRANYDLTVAYLIGHIIETQKRNKKL